MLFVKNCNNVSSLTKQLAVLTMNMPHHLKLAECSLSVIDVLQSSCPSNCNAVGACVQVQELRQNMETVHVKEELNRLRTVMQDMRQRLSDDEAQVIKLLYMGI